MNPWHLLGHLIIGSILGFFIFRKTKKLGLFFLFLFVSFAIDVDHLLDFWIAYGFSLDLKKFLEIDFFYINKKVFVLLHSWEIVTILFLLSGFAKKYRWLLLTVALAIFGHILWDTISYQIMPVDYFLIYRALNNFRMRCGW